MLKPLFQAAALAAAVLASVPAFAQDKLADVRVYYGDLDLSDAAGVQTLDRRLSHAVSAACPSDKGVRDLSRVREAALCRAAKRAEIAPLRETALASATGSQNTLSTAR